MSAIFLNSSYDPTIWAGFGEFTVSVARSAEDKTQVSQWLEAEHFIGDFKPVGHSFCHIIKENEQPVAVVQWAACAYHLKDREAFIGWSKLQCAKRRNLVVNNVRFLVLEAARRPNLASKALAHSVRALADHWMEHFGYQPLLAETFTDIEQHEGTCYKAAGWTPLGLTEGNSRQRAEFYLPNQRPKKLWVKELRADTKARLCAATLAPEHQAGETEGKGAPLPVTASMLQPLAAVLRQVKDPRGSNRYYHIGVLLTLLSLGLLCGATNLNEILRHLQRLTQQQRRALGLRKRSGALKIEVPTYMTFSLLLRALDLDAFAQTLSQWLSAHRGALPASLALDGKKIRGTMGTIVTLCDTEQKVPIALSVTTEEGGEQACARGLLRRDQTVLLNSTVSLDALYANNENAQIIVQEKGADYFVSLKDNQPTLLTHVRDAFTTGTPSIPAQLKPGEQGSQPESTGQAAGAIGGAVGIPAATEGKSRRTPERVRLTLNIGEGNAGLFKKRPKPAMEKS
jgi:hypothetical protein